MVKKQYSPIKKNNKGITLIALIITIILMLILASVTVNVTIKGGLFNYAKKAKDNTEIASEKEIIQKALVLAKSTSKTGKITIKNVQSSINEITSKNNVEIINFGDTIYVSFKNSQRYYEINNNQKVEGPIEIVKDTTPGEFDGTGTETDPYIIMSIEDLVYFSYQTNKKRLSYDGVYIKLGRSLDFNSDLSYENPNTTEYDEYLGGDGKTGLKEQLTNGKGFMPISRNAIAFSGIFNGDGNVIYNIIMNTVNDAGLFAITKGSEISNITVTGNITTTVTFNNNGLGGIAGRDLGESLIINCHNLCDLQGNTNIGGIVGRVAKECIIINCSNGGKIKVEGQNQYRSAGGIVGEGEDDGSIIINCYNLNTIENESTQTYAGAGGIIGTTSNNVVTVLNCYNAGKVTGKYSQGAIVGGYWATKGWISILEKCYFLNNSCNYPVGEMLPKPGVITEGTNSTTKTYMQSDNFIKDLNDYVDTYNDEHKEDEGFIALKRWEKGIDGYPCFVKD